MSAAEIAASLSRDEMFDLIVEIDRIVGHWPFTSRLAEHFATLESARKVEESIDDARGRDGSLKARQIGGRK